MRELSLEEVKKLQIQILDEVAAFCDQHNIKYFLMAGTLLGAVRHQGYIPWDDDIDIGMLREDYEYFIKVFNKSKNIRLYLYNYHTDSNCIFPFTKICIFNSLVKESSYHEYIQYGINIDLFPIDGINKNPKKIYKKIRFWRRIRELKAVKILPSNPNNINFFIKKILSFFCKFISYKLIYKRIEQFFVKNKASALQQGNIVWGYGECELVSPMIFDKMIKLQFEGKLYSAPENSYLWLKSVYGNDYMLLPPIEKRISHNIKAFLLD